MSASQAKAAIFSYRCDVAEGPKADVEVTTSGPEITIEYAIFTLSPQGKILNLRYRVVFEQND